MGKLTTHVLDVSNGTPAAGVRIGVTIVTTSQRWPEDLRNQYTKLQPDAKFGETQPAKSCEQRAHVTTGPDGRLAVPMPKVTDSKLASTR